MSKTSVRLALHGSVTKAPPPGPPVSFQATQASTVPRARSAESATPPSVSSHSILVAEKYGSSTRPVARRTCGSSPWARSASQRSAVRRSCQTSARWRGRPVRRSQATTVSRWLVIPMAATVWPASARRRASSASVAPTAAADLVGVVLHPTGPGEVLRQLPVRKPEWPARLVHGEAAHPGGPCVDGDHGGHKLREASQQPCPGVSRRRRSMRIGVLTGGGDCPGLNAVIRAVVRKGRGSSGTTWSASATAGGAWWSARWSTSLSPPPGASSTGAAPSWGPPGPTPTRRDDGVRRALDTLRRERIDALVAIGGEDTLGVAAKLGDEGRAHRRRPQDHRQRPVGHRLHLRLRHRRPDRHRRHRPAPHHRRVPRPGHGRSRSWAATPAGSPPSPAWPAAPT